MLVYSKKQAQIKTLIFDKAFTKVLMEYSNYSNVFLIEYVAKLSENTRMNKHAIKLEKNKQSPFGPIYSLEPIELETLKTYIKINLANGFIWPFKSFARAPILFNRKPNRSFCLCIDYQGFNNITIKNQYPLPLISKSLN